MLGFKLKDCPVAISSGPSAPDPGSLEIIPVKAPHWPGLFQIRLEPHQARFVSPPLELWRRQAFQRTSRSYQIYGIWHSRVPVGLFTLHLHDLSAWLGGMQVDIRWQRQGLGRKAVGLLIRSLQQLRMKRLGLDVHPENQAALNFYRSLQFKNCPGSGPNSEYILELNTPTFPL